MTIPKQEMKPHSKQRETQIELEDPSLYTPDPNLEHHWQHLQFVSNLPVIKATIGVKSNEHDVHCMIDSGKA